MSNVPETKENLIFVNGLYVASCYTGKNGGTKYSNRIVVATNSIYNVEEILNEHFKMQDPTQEISVSSVSSLVVCDITENTLCMVYTNETDSGKTMRTFTVRIIPQILDDHDDTLESWRNGVLYGVFDSDESAKVHKDGTLVLDTAVDTDEHSDLENNQRNEDDEDDHDVDHDVDFNEDDIGDGFRDDLGDDIDDDDDDDDDDGDFERSTEPRILFIVATDFSSAMKALEYMGFYTREILGVSEAVEGVVTILGGQLVAST